MNVRVSINMRFILRFILSAFAVCLTPNFSFGEGAESSMLSPKFRKDLKRSFSAIEMSELENRLLQIDKKVGGIKADCKLDSKNPALADFVRYRVGWCLLNQQQFDDALRLFEEVIKSGSVVATEVNTAPAEAKSIELAFDVSQEALYALTIPYIEVFSRKTNGDLAKPVDYFRKHTDSHITYRRVLSQAAKRLELKHRWSPAAEAWLEVIVASGDAVSVAPTIGQVSKYEAAQNWTEAVRKTSASNVDRLRFVEHAVRMAQAIRVNSPREDSKLTKKEISQLSFLEIAARDNITRMQQASRVRGGPDDFKLVARAYDFYGIGFPQQMSSVKIMGNRAETLFRAQHWTHAGLVFEELARTSKSSRKQAEYRESAIQAYVNALKNSEKLTPLELVRARRGVRETGSTWLAKHGSHPAAASTAYNIGQSWYEDRVMPEAINAFTYFIKTFANDKRTRDAIFMIINAYSQMDDFKGLIRTAKAFEKDPLLSDEDKKSIRELSHRAQLKGVQAFGGNFGTKEYAENLVNLAQSNSSLGAVALYEAFTSLNTKHDPEMYEIGEILIQKYPDSTYTKGVASSMAQTALLTADFERAARYLMRFAGKYPSEPGVVDRKKNAAQIYESLGDFKSARRIYLALGDNDSVARCDFAGSDWPQLERSSTKIEPGLGLYYYSLSLWRQGRYDDVLPRLTQLVRATNSEHSAHARLLLAHSSLESFRNMQLKGADDQNALVSKIKAYQSLSKELGEIVRLGAGQWTLASLYYQGQANIELARFLAKSPMPMELKREEILTYKKALLMQVKQYKQAADESFKQCLTVAEKFEVFTRYVGGCRSKGSTDLRLTDQEVPVALSVADDGKRPEPKNVAQLRRQLHEKPRAVNTLLELGATYIFDMRYRLAVEIFNRALEIEPKSAEALSGRGLGRVFMGDHELAATDFKKALKISAKDPVATWNLHGLYKQFGFSGRVKSLALQRAMVARPQLLHPMAR